MRRWLQKLCRSPHGERLFGSSTVPLYESVTRLVVALGVVASIAVAAISSPDYRRRYYLNPDRDGLPWFTQSGALLALLFVVEFFMKVCKILGGFQDTPLK